MSKYLLSLFIAIFSFQSVAYSQASIAREWNEILLESIRNDFARPTVHARNLFHSSLIMYDSWAVFDEKAETVFLGKRFGNYFSEFEGINRPLNIEAARHEVMSYAMFRLLNNRFPYSPSDDFNPRVAYEALMQSYGYDPFFESQDYQSGSFAALGIYLAEQILQFGYEDGSNEYYGYSNMYYEPSNSGLLLEEYNDVVLENPNAWQPLIFRTFIDQSGNEIPLSPPFLSPEWGQVTPFALKNEDLQILNNGFESYVYNDPGAPYEIQNSNENGIDDPYKWNFALVLAWSAHLDPNDETQIDISPGAIGNTQLSDFPTSFEEYKAFYDFAGGGDSGLGHNLNPVTGQPYEPQMVKRADYARVLAEFWADGPDSETPPGHWFTILNYVNEHPQTIKKMGGEGETLNDLEWDVKSYLAMGGAMHDAAVNAWGIKGYYDYIRPISAIRYMANMGQSSNASLANYNPQGLPLIPGLIELVAAGDPLEGDAGENIGEIKVLAWKGPDYINDPEIDVVGVDWILGTRWWPYQRPTFVTPPFAGYVSGHSTYSRAAAEVLTLLTGSGFFPGGMGTFDIEQNNFLVFENGPSENITLQWATYQDASDQTSLSRIWGGIHPPIDDIPGRIIGDKIGKEAFALANNYFEGVSPPNHFSITATAETCFDLDNGSVSISATVDDNYIAEIDGISYPFDKDWALENMNPGTYEICVHKASEPLVENCFSFVIDAADELDISSSSNEIGQIQSIDLKVNSGTPPFVVKINDEIVDTFESNNIKLTVKQGDEVSVESQLACEGVYKLSVPITASDILFYPNPTESVFTILGDKVYQNDTLILIYDVNGKLLETPKGKVQANQLEVSLQNHPPGIYLVHMPELNRTFKVLKK
ncbi:MAG: T9SS type A sorting domain-containing protein [Maribacter sp.]